MVGTSNPRISIWIIIPWLCVFLTLFSLGTWQLLRMQEKNALIERIEQRMGQEPLSVLPENADALRALEYVPVKLTGHFVANQQVRIGPRNFYFHAGYYLYDPFILEDGRAIWVLRGWTPLEHAETDDVAIAPTTDGQTLEGIVRLPEEPGPFTPDNTPETGQWYWGEIGLARKLTGLDLLPVIVRAVSQTGDGKLPKPLPAEVSESNDHLGYALTWFGIAVGLLAVSWMVWRQAHAEISQE